MLTFLIPPDLYQQFDGAADSYRELLASVKEDLPPEQMNKECRFIHDAMREFSYYLEFLGCSNINMARETTLELLKSLSENTDSIAYEKIKETADQMLGWVEDRMCLESTRKNLTIDESKAMAIEALKKAFEDFHLFRFKSDEKLNLNRSNFGRLLANIRIDRPSLDDCENAYEGLRKGLQEMRQNNLTLFDALDKCYSHSKLSLEKKPIIHICT